MSMFRTLFILSDVRCGSTYAAELLSYNAYERLGLELWDLAREHFQPLTDESERRDLRALYDRLWMNPQGWRSAMVKCAHLSIINKLAYHDAEITKLFFGPDVHWILIRRKDFIARAISLSIARMTGQYHEYSDKSTDHELRELNIEAINTSLVDISLSDIFLSACVSKFNNFREFLYEDIIVDERGFINSVGEFAFGRKILGSNDEIIRPKILRTHSAEKALQRNEFVNYFIRNFHPVSSE